MFDFKLIETIYEASRITCNVIEQKAAEVRKSALRELAEKFVNEITPDINAVLALSDKIGGMRGVKFNAPPYQIKVERLNNMAAFTLIDDSSDVYIVCSTDVEKCVESLDRRYDYELKMLVDFIRNYDAFKIEFEKDVQAFVMEKIRKKSEDADAKLYAALDLKGGGVCDASGRYS